MNYSFFAFVPNLKIICDHDDLSHRIERDIYMICAAMCDDWLL